MTGLYVILWLYCAVATVAVLACLYTMWTGLATGRHRAARRSPMLRVWRDLVDGFKGGLRLFYGIGLD